MLFDIKGLTKHRRFRRLFVVLTASWILFCLFIQPILMAGRGFNHYRNDVKFCYDDLMTSRTNLQGCLAHAQQELDSGLYAGFGVRYDYGHNWSYGWYFRSMWQFLVVEIVIPPALIYGFVWMVASISIWIWRGSKATAAAPPSPGTQTTRAHVPSRSRR